MGGDPKSRERRAAFSIDALIERCPHKEAALRELYESFVQRTFLPERQDVERFLQRYLPDPPKVATRRSAERQLFETLAELDEQQLAHVCAEARLSGRSQLEVIADAILKRTG